METVLQVRGREIGPARLVLVEWPWGSLPCGTSSSTFAAFSSPSCNAGSQTLRVESGPGPRVLFKPETGSSQTSLVAGVQFQHSQAASDLNRQDVHDLSGRHNLASEVAGVSPPKTRSAKRILGPLSSGLVLLRHAVHGFLTGDSILIFNSLWRSPWRVLRADFQFFRHAPRQTYTMGILFAARRRRLLMSHVKSIDRTGFRIVDNAEVIAAARTGALSLVIARVLEIKRSKHPDGISSPFKTRLSNPKRICSRSNATQVYIDPQTSNVIMQIRDPPCAQNLITRFCK
jgi:hypothetical protein